MPFNQNYPRSFVASSIREYAPPASGVYGITNSREWIYIGMADNIQAVLLDHLQGSDATLLQHNPTGFVFEVCDRSRRGFRHERLIAEYCPTCNRRAPVGQ